MQNKPKPSPCGNEQTHFERLKYYFGKMLTVRDFQAEQSYLNEKRWLLNRLGVGWGVLCGLKVSPCATGSSQVVVAPGFALDAYGHEILVCENQVIDLKDAVDCEPATSPPEAPCYYLYLKYFECDVEPTPIPVEDCGVFETDCVYNRTREGFKIYASTKPPHWATPLDPPVWDDCGCQYDCYRFLENPGAVISDHCGHREACAEIPLARVCYTEGGAIDKKDIEHCEQYRKLAYSNEILAELLHCLKAELWKAHSAKYDRRRFVPLLAHTLKGVHHEDGKALKIENAGKHPARLTTDRDHGHIWITDAAATKMMRLNRATNQIVHTPEIELPEKSWGIAFDGHKHVWISHYTTSPGKVTRVNVCDLDDHKTISILPDWPREVLFDGRYIWVSHGWSEQTQQDCRQTRTSQSEAAAQLVLSRIDPKACERVERYVIASPAWCQPSSPIVSMTFDGHAIWIAYTAWTTHQSTNAIARRIDLVGDTIKEQDPIILDGDEAERITFDGSHVWVTHNDGGNKIDTKRQKKKKEAMDTKEKQGAIAFDGCHLWTAEIGDGEVSINRVELMNARLTEGEEIDEFDTKTEHYDVSEMCFDGAYLWVAAYHQRQQEPPTGLIHRLLP